MSDRVSLLSLQRLRIQCWTPILYLYAVLLKADRASPTGKRSLKFWTMAVDLKPRSVARLTSGA